MINLYFQTILDRFVMWCGGLLFVGHNIHFEAQKGLRPLGTVQVHKLYLP